jgi:hypothetical protein
MPSLGIMVGAGSALLFAWIVSRLPRLAAASMALLAVVALAAAQIGYPTPDKAYAVAIHPRAGPSDYELYKFYRPYIAGDRPIAVLFSIGRNSFAQWTLWEDCKCRRVVQQPFVIRAVDSDRMREIAATCLATTGVDTIVAIDANIQPPGGITGAMLRRSSASMKGSASKALSPSNAPGSTDSSSGSAQRSCACPRVSITSTGLPSASTRAWILVVSPPRPSRVLRSRTLGHPLFSPRTTSRLGCSPGLAVAGLGPPMPTQADAWTAAVLVDAVPWAGRTVWFLAPKPLL